MRLTLFLLASSLAALALAVPAGSAGGPTLRRSVVGKGRWRVVARLDCESGDDGSPVIIQRFARVTIK